MNGNKWDFGNEQWRSAWRPGPKPPPKPGPRPGPCRPPKPCWLPRPPGGKTCRKKRRRKGQAEILGLILVCIGIATLCIFILPYKAWLVILGVIMIICGYKLFIG